jgi:hypothetical protein
MASVAVAADNPMVDASVQCSPSVCFPVEAAVFSLRIYTLEQVMQIMEAFGKAFEIAKTIIDMQKQQCVFMQQFVPTVADFGPFPQVQRDLLQSYAAKVTLKYVLEQLANWLSREMVQMAPLVTAWDNTIRTAQSILAKVAILGGASELSVGDKGKDDERRQRRRKTTKDDEGKDDDRGKGDEGKDDDKRKVDKDDECKDDDKGKDDDTRKVDKDDECKDVDKGKDDECKDDDRGKGDEGKDDDKGRDDEGKDDEKGKGDEGKDDDKGRRRRRQRRRL